MSNFSYREWSLVVENSFLQFKWTKIHIRKKISTRLYRRNITWHTETVIPQPKRCRSDKYVNFTEESNEICDEATGYLLVCYNNIDKIMSIRIDSPSKHI
ncbi:1111_t:CDS:2 [Diversispora eburnea]|uniref:1111_t:CDS:1 n=1 Tax=Diversispora eburnea TaxID=1213867 RepID=A0A9N9FK64_9GLOM|nr:1111_t:CDS:2 [Diversispora eburnea]